MSSNQEGLPGWFPGDFTVDPDLLDEFEDDSYETASEEGGSSIAAQMGLANADGITGQLIELARTPAWVNEKRDAHGQWTRGGGPGSARLAAVATGRPPAGFQRAAIRRAQQNRQSAQAAVAERISEEKARQALDEARAEVEKVAQQLKDEARTAENAKHRAKLALHAVLILGGGILAAVLAHFDISPVLGGLAATLPLLATELTDWRKKL